MSSFGSQLSSGANYIGKTAVSTANYVGKSAVSTANYVGQSAVQTANYVNSSMAWGVQGMVNMGYNVVKAPVNFASSCMGFGQHEIESMAAQAEE